MIVFANVITKKIIANDEEEVVAALAQNVE